MYGEFQDKVVVVTGGAGGFGRGLVHELNSFGARTVSLDLKPNLDASVSLALDLSNEAELEEAMETQLADLGPIEYLVCASGVVKETPFDEVETSQWNTVLNASLTSTFLVARKVIRSMIASGGGSIVTCSSGYARKGYPLGSDYSAAKSAIEGLTKSIALEYASRGIRANSVAPGPIRTAMIEDNPAFDEEAKSRVIPLGRVGEVEDVIPAILFLLSDQARYITGQVLHVNGGLLMP